MKKSLFHFLLFKNGGNGLNGQKTITSSFSDVKRAVALCPRTYKGWELKSCPRFLLWQYGEMAYALRSRRSSLKRECGFKSHYCHIFMKIENKEEMMHYLVQLFKLIELIHQGKGNEEEADDIRNTMDYDWRVMTEEEIAFCNDISAAIG